MVCSEGNMLLKNPVTPPGIDPGTVRLVAQRLNHYATPGPSCNTEWAGNSGEKGKESKPRMHYTFKEIQVTVFIWLHR